MAKRDRIKELERQYGGRGWFNVECKTCFGTGVL
jgi:hypothetical protein